MLLGLLALRPYISSLSQSAWIDLYFLFHFEAIIWKRSQTTETSKVIPEIITFIPVIGRKFGLDTPDRSRNKIQKCSYRVLAISEKKDSPLHQGLNVMLCLGVACTACSFFQLLYAISTFRFFINEYSTVNAMYANF